MKFLGDSYKVSKIVNEEVVRPTCPPGIRKAIIRDIVGFIMKGEEGLEEGEKK